MANIGNFIHRTTTFTWNNFEGEAAVDPGPDGRELVREAGVLAAQALELLDEVRFRDSLSKILAIADLGNEYFQRSQPWLLVKSDRAKCEAVLHACLELCIAISTLLQPFLPRSSEKILGLLGAQPRLGDLGKPHRRIKLASKPEIPFKKLEDSQIELAKSLTTRSKPVGEYFRR